MVKMAAALQPSDPYSRLEGRRRTMKGESPPSYRETSLKPDTTLKLKCTSVDRRSYQAGWEAESCS